MILLSILLEIIRNSLKIRFPQNLPHHASTEWEDYWQRDWKPTGHCMTFDNGKQTVGHAYRDLRRCSDASANYTYIYILLSSNHLNTLIPRCRPKDYNNQHKLLINVYRET